MRRLQRAIVGIGCERLEFTADDLRERVEIPSNVNPTVVGAAFQALANARIIRRVRFESTKRPQAHARPQSVWVLAGPAAARAWLVNHPEIVIPASVADDVRPRQQQTMF